MVTVYQKSMVAMTMPFIVSIASSDQVLAEKILEEIAPQVLAELQRLEEKFSPFKETSLLSRYRSGDKTTLLDQEFQTVYGLATLIQEKTAGAFDAYYDGQFNPTGFVKGWIVKTIFNKLIEPLLHQPHIEAVAFNGSGDMQVATRPYSDFVWKIGIENPDQTNKMIAAYQLTTGSLATSGFSKRGQHIKTQTNDLKQVTILDSNLEWADAWATAGLAVGQEKFHDLIAQNRLTGLYVADQHLQFFHQGELTHVQEI